jgi:3-dehydroquinate dehydratase
LAGVLLRKFLEQRMIALEEKYEVYEHSYKSILSYHSFDSKEPKSLGVRFLEQGPENLKMEGERQEKEELIASLEGRRE